MFSRKTSSGIGNVFAVPLGDGSFSIGQVVGREAEVLDSITVALFCSRLSQPEIKSVTGAPELSELIAVQFTTKDLLASKVWPVLCSSKVRLPRKLYPYEDTRKNGWIGAKMIGSGILVSFLQAFHGIEFWDAMKDPECFTRLLLDPDLKPNGLRFKSEV